MPDGVLAIIPARGGSKGLPDKHLAMLAGRPMILYTFAAARASRMLTRTIVSTDDEAIAALARAHEIEVPFVRPAALAADDTPILPVIQHALDALATPPAAPPEIVVLLQPTSPLRRAEHIDEAVTRLRATGADSVVSVVEVPHAFNPVSVLRDDGGRLVPFLDGPTVTRRQDKPRVLARNGPAVLAVRASVIAQGSLYGRDSRPMVMTPETSIDIDTAWDLAIAALALERQPAPRTG